MPAETPSWSARPAPKARPAIASAAAPAGTLRATTTMRAARAEERARTEALRTQVDELNAALVVANAEAARALAQEQARVDRFSDRVDTMQRDLDAARTTWWRQSGGQTRLTRTDAPRPTGARRGGVGPGRSRKAGRCAPC